MPFWSFFRPTFFAAARLIFSLRRTDHISDRPTLITLHWLRDQKRVSLLFKMVVLMYEASHGSTPLYLTQLVPVADLPGRRCLRSARTNYLLLVPSVKLPIVGGRAFPVAGPTIWNSLPDNVTSAPSLSIFR